MSLEIAYIVKIYPRLLLHGNKPWWNRLSCSFVDPLWVSPSLNFATGILVILDPSWTEAPVNMDVSSRQLFESGEKSSPSQLCLQFYQLYLLYFALACLYFPMPIPLDLHV